MALHWNIEKCPLSKEERTERWQVIESMIWLTMVIDIGEITQDNLDTVEFRLRLYSRVTRDNYDSLIAFLPKLIGLSTNVHTTTDKQFEKRILEILTRDIRYEMKRSKHLAGAPPLTE